MTIYYIFKFLRIWALFASITLLFSMFICFTSNNIFKSSGKKAVYSLIPIYNLLELLDIVKLSRYCFILLILPLVNILIIFVILYRLSIIYNTNKSFTLGLIVFPALFLPVLNYSNITRQSEEKKDDVSNEMIGILTEKEIQQLNKEETVEKVDNVFKREIQEIENVPKFKAKTIKYREMMLEEDKIDKIEKVKPIKVEEIKENKFIKTDKEENDSIEIVEL